MKLRLLTALGLAVFGIPLLIFSNLIVFNIALGLLAFISVFEMMRTLGIHKNYFVSVPVYLISLSVPFATYFANGIGVKNYLLIAAAVFFAFLLYLFGVAVFAKGKMKLAEITETFGTVFYIIISYTALGVLRVLPFGHWNLIAVFVGAFTSDVFAFLVGMTVGKHKLIPEISPKKTVEGAIGGVVFATLGFVLYGFILSKTVGLTAHYEVLAPAGFVVAIVSQIGDLIASFIKRERGVKDYGNILPGHGGIMDRFDSVLAVSSVLMIISIVFPMFS